MVPPPCDVPVTWGNYTYYLRVQQDFQVSESEYILGSYTCIRGRSRKYTYKDMVTVSERRTFFADEVIAVSEAEHFFAEEVIAVSEKWVSTNKEVETVSEKRILSYKEVVTVSENKYRHIRKW